MEALWNRKNRQGIAKFLEEFSECSRLLGDHPSSLRQIAVSYKFVDSYKSLSNSLDQVAQIPSILGTTSREVTTILLSTNLVLGFSFEISLWDPPTISLTQGQEEPERPHLRKTTPDLNTCNFRTKAGQTDPAVIRLVVHLQVQAAPKGSIGNFGKFKGQRGILESSGVKKGNFGKFKGETEIKRDLGVKWVQGNAGIDLLNWHFHVRTQSFTIALFYHDTLLLSPGLEHAVISRLSYSIASFSTKISSNINTANPTTPPLHIEPIPAKFLSIEIGTDSGTEAASNGEKSKLEEAITLQKKGP
ncbi:hypothetical protein VNO77_27816 [Canavalia gladiata]|uniref:Uncharacterized protein n=1 Tax=Canavalia gladiata TaxID=3824 RepID=A0AAN9KVD5_CANGL